VGVHRKDAAVPIGPISIGVKGGPEDSPDRGAGKGR